MYPRRDALLLRTSVFVPREGVTVPLVRLVHVRRSSHEQQHILSPRALATFKFRVFPATRDLRVVCSVPPEQGALTPGLPPDSLSLAARSPGHTVSPTRAWAGGIWLFTAL